MMQSIDIAEVARTTGLSARALVKPLRTGSGRRCYGAGELERLHQLIALKRAGLSLQQIKALFDRKPIDLRQLIALQLDTLNDQACALSEARTILRTTLSRIDRGEPIDAATFCSLIRTGDVMMTDETERWRAISVKYMTEEGKADFAAKQGEMAKASADFNQAGYAARWQALGSRIKAALPMDPASDVAQAFVAEWKALLAPFTNVATPAMKEGWRQMYANMDKWEGQADPGFDHQVLQFIQAASAAAK